MAKDWDEPEYHQGEYDFGHGRINDWFDDFTDRAGSGWDDLSRSDQNDIAERFMEDIVHGDVEDLRDLFVELGVEWTDEDWDTFREVYG